jgi:hypothetical protein
MMPAKTFKQYLEDYHKQDVSPMSGVEVVTAKEAWHAAKQNITFEEALKVVAQEIIRRAKDLLGGEIDLNQMLKDHTEALDIAGDQISNELCNFAGVLLKWTPVVSQTFHEIRNRVKVKDFKERRNNE